MTRTITIDQLRFIETPPQEAPAPVAPPAPPKPKALIYCPDCGPRPRPAATCTPSRVQYTGVVSRRCKKHAWRKYHNDMVNTKEKMYLDRLHRRG